VSNIFKKPDSAITIDTNETKLKNKYRPKRKNKDLNWPISLAPGYTKYI
jgi:hypothetical protein